MNGALPASRRACPSVVRVPHFILRLLRAGAVLALAVWSSHSGAQVLLVMSDDSAGYRAIADEVRNGLDGLRDGTLRIDSATPARLTRIDRASLQGYELVVTVGLAAAQATSTREQELAVWPRTLCLLIPRQSFERLLANQPGANGPRLTAVYIDQPLSRQFDLLKLALPERTRVGVILGPTSQALADALGKEAREHGLSLVLAHIDDKADLYGALQTVLPASDLLLMLPDPVVASADTVYGLLLTSYREQLPVVGFSEGLLNAGALLSLYSSARQQGRQGGETARRMLSSAATLPEPEYPKYFTARVNASVARSLGLHVPSEAELDAALNGRTAGAGEGTQGAGATSGNAEGHP